MIKLLNEMTKIKNEYTKLKYTERKTKAARERKFDKMHQLSRAFRDLEEQLDWSYIDASRLNLTSPNAGPWCLLDATNFKLESPWYFSFEFSTDCEKTRYVGEFSLLDDKCGIDNLKMITNQISA